MRRADPSDGEYLLLSIAITVWRDTFSFSANCSWVIACITRCTFTLFFIPAAPILPSKILVGDGVQGNQEQRQVRKD